MASKPIRVLVTSDIAARPAPRLVDSSRGAQQANERGPGAGETNGRVSQGGGRSSAALARHVDRVAAAAEASPIIERRVERSDLRPLSDPDGQQQDERMSRAKKEQRCSHLGSAGSVA